MLSPRPKPGCQIHPETWTPVFPEMMGRDLGMLLSNASHEAVLFLPVQVLMPLHLRRS